MTVKLVLDEPWHEDFNITGTTRHTALRNAMFSLAHDAKFVRENSYRELVVSARCSQLPRPWGKREELGRSERARPITVKMVHFFHFYG